MLTDKSNLIKLQLFIILLFYLMKIWHRPIGGHVQTTFVISSQGISPANQNTP